MKMRKLVSTALLNLVTSFAVGPLLAEHPNLVGSWRLDAAASDFGSMPQAEEGTLTISTGSHKILHMSVTVKGPHRESTTEADWKVDDRYHPVQGDAPGTLLAKWEGDELLGKRSTEAGMQEIRLMLGPGGATLTETITSASNVTKLVWRR